MISLLLHLIAPQLLGGSQGAASGPRSLVVSVEDRSVHQLYGEYARQHGITGATAHLSCKVLGGPFTLCLKVEEQGMRRFVTQADLVAWELSAEQARAQAAAAVESSPWKELQIEGGGSFWQVQGAHADAALLHTEWLAQIGEQVRVGAPARGVLVAWPAGDPELDHIMAVAVRRMHEQLPDRLSPVVLSWDGERWTQWGQAKARAAVEPPLDTPPGTPAP